MSSLPLTESFIPLSVSLRSLLVSFILLHMFSILPASSILLPVPFTMLLSTLMTISLQHLLVLTLVHACIACILGEKR